MLFEQRRYTLKPGALGPFWQAQLSRDETLVQPIQARLVGYFSTRAAVGEQVIHLYRYDSFADWQARLHGLYQVAALAPYFRTVRALLLAQENQFFGLPPVDALSPLWGEGRDWLPARGPSTLFERPGPAVIEVSTSTLLPGSQPAYWALLAQYASAASATETAGLMARFVSLVGTLHQVQTWRGFASEEARLAWRAARDSLAPWPAFATAAAPLISHQQTQLLAPAPHAVLSPLFPFEETRP